MEKFAQPDLGHANVFLFCVICLGLESVLGGKLGEVGSLLVTEECRCSHAIQIRRCYSLYS